jgi:predicted methyltransferase
MDEIDTRILLGILKHESIQEIATYVDRTVSVIHGRMAWLRDQGYIKPWEANKARSKALTEDGRKMVKATYGEEPFKVQE